MIRKMQTADIDETAGIWLDTNLKAHDFIPAEYWKGNYDAVKEMISQAEVYIYEDKSRIQGFAGLDQDYIAGIFVREEAQNRGIGKSLLDRVKEEKRKLALNVYVRNMRAVRFYLREGFRIVEDGTDENTGEKEYLMLWEKESIPGKDRRN